MPLSANTLFHFTDDKDNLKSLLEQNFRVFYCREKLDLSNGSVEYVVPMVSFCDIPLSEIKTHIAKYGRYGIGLTKEWGIRNRLNPVLYVSKGSHLSESYIEAFVHFTSRGKTADGTWTDEQKKLTDVLRYIKNYEGALTRKGSSTDNYRFSDEREWRYVPHIKEACEMIMDREEYEMDKDSYDRGLTNQRLVFEPNDIKYIIIDNDAEIGEFIDHLRHAKRKKYVLDDVERLTTRILTTQQIEQDI